MSSSGPPSNFLLLPSIRIEMASMTCAFINNQCSSGNRFRTRFIIGSIAAKSWNGERQRSTLYKRRGRDWDSQTIRRHCLSEIQNDRLALLLPLLISFLNGAGRFKRTTFRAFIRFFFFFFLMQMSFLSVPNFKTVAKSLQKGFESSQSHQSLLSRGSMDAFHFTQSPSYFCSGILRLHLSLADCWARYF